MKKTNLKKGLSRRSFVQKAAITAAGLYIVPRHVLGRGYVAPSDKLYIAAVGCGGEAENDIHTQEQNLRQKRGEEATMKKQFEGDIDRFKELKHIQ